MDDSTTHDETNHSASGSKKKDDIAETEEHPEEADEDSGGEADDNADQGDEVIFNFCSFNEMEKNLIDSNDRMKMEIFL